MTTPENPYNGNPSPPGTGQPADATQQFGQPAQQPYGAPQSEPTQAMPDYGQMQPEGVTLEDLLSMPTFNEQIERQTTAGMPDNMDMKDSAKGNTLTFDATINESLTDDLKEREQ